MRVGSQKTNAPGRGLEKGDVEFINGNGVSNTLARRGLGENGSIFPRPKGETAHGRMWYIGIGHRALLPVGGVASIGAGRCELPAPVRISNQRRAAHSVSG